MTRGARRLARVALVTALGSPAGVLGARSARAQTPGGPPPVSVRADSIELDADKRELVLRGNVELDSAPFHLSADELRLTRTPRGVVVKGTGRIAFCPCLAQPLAVRFKSALIAPPSDLIVEQPTLEVFHTPIFWLPGFWLRGAGEIGVLAPDVAYRGDDGMFLGEGVHIPLRKGDTKSGVDLRAGAYLKGGAAVEAALKTPESTTTIRWDHLDDAAASSATAAGARDAADGLAIDARGAAGAGGGGPKVGWDVDAVRGERGVLATTDLDAASRVFDRAAAASWLSSGGWTVSTGLGMTSARGDGLGQLGAAGPTAVLRRDGTLGEAGAYDARVEGGALAGSVPTASYARAAGGALLAAHLGPLRAAWSVRGSGDVAAAGAVDGGEAAAKTTLALGIPIERSFGPDADLDPWKHRLEPAAEAGALALVQRDVAIDAPLLPVFPGAAPAADASGVGWFADLGFSTTLGTWGRKQGLELAASAGGAGATTAVGATPEGAAGLVRWRAAATLPWLGLGAEGAHVLQPSVAGAGAPASGVDGSATTGPAPPAGPGTVLTARLRLGPLSSVHLGLNVAGREGVDPVLARLLTDAPLPATVGFLATDGWTGGARLSFPLTAYLTARGGADADLSAERLLGGRGSLEFHDRCGCVVITATGSGRVGRPGVDAWLTVSLVRR